MASEFEISAYQKDLASGSPQESHMILIIEQHPEPSLVVSTTEEAFRQLQNSTSLALCSASNLLPYDVDVPKSMTTIGAAAIRTVSY